ncbi:HPr family phosphocarrier protein [Sinorhizobium alkalisoli]|uniref:Phosphocarrier protein HPr n=1 Tax=Sinorhizobium alkalisoli TaxID=1752398 RepID=A0A1E3VIY9_9HYPH|nr:HPr family phosphocarrier protein [Sinorhizobium alkalisoli]MCA1492206.1 HPr family phosphocarrier protein [Ensifer sp. NBAIM29]MCG5480917.1 HPr family phosphocarrier protein [Sinorhizobium alkalisoli]ODR93251.1 zinc transporter [Sinorhizobium alkalisoli]
MDNRSRQQAPAAGDAQGYCQTEIEVTHGFGLHARPSVTFTRLAKSFPCTVEIEVNGSQVWLNGKSIVKIMGARIRRGSILKIRTRGLRAAEAIHALQALVERDFDEEKKHGRSA